MSPDRDKLRALILECLSAIAPDIDGAALDPGASLRQQAELDSFDFLQLCIQIAQRSGVEVPEADYAKLATLESAVDYLAAHGATC